MVIRIECSCLCELGLASLQFSTKLRYTDTLPQRRYSTPPTRCATPQMCLSVLGECGRWIQLRLSTPPGPRHPCPPCCRPRTPKPRRCPTNLFDTSFSSEICHSFTIYLSRIFGHVLSRKLLYFERAVFHLVSDPPRIIWYLWPRSPHFTSAFPRLWFAGDCSSPTDPGILIATM